MTATDSGSPELGGQGPIIGSVTALATVAVKALRLRQRDEVHLGPMGVADNRRFFLIDQRNRLVNGKQIGELSAVLADYDEEREWLALSFPDGNVVEGAIGLGEWVETRFFSRLTPAQFVLGEWSAALSAYAGRALRLVCPDPSLGGVDRGRKGAVSLISRASVERLTDVAGTEVDPRRFRMLVEVDGFAAHAEDDLIGKHLRIGDALVLFHGHVGRCLVTGKDPDTGVTDLPTLDLLRSYRQGLDTTEPLAFGVYGEVVEPGPVRVGDPVRAV